MSHFKFAFLRRASDNSDCYPQMGPKKLYKIFLKPAPRFGMFSLGLLEAKNEENVKQLFVSFDWVKNKFAH